MTKLPGLSTLFSLFHDTHHEAPCETPTRLFTP